MRRGELDPTLQMERARAEAEARRSARDPDLALAREMTRARCAHLSDLELRLARRFAGVSLEDVDGPPVGVLVGESPGPNTTGRRPLMPWPSGSSGERLMSYAGMTAGQYLGRFLRRNLFPSHVPDGEWSATAAIEAAAAVRRELVALGSFKVVLLGARVSLAFGLDGPWQRAEEFHVDPGGETGTPLYLASIPHPSGLNRVYNEERARTAAGAAVLWAAELLKGWAT